MSCQESAFKIFKHFFKQSRMLCPILMFNSINIETKQQRSVLFHITPWSSPLTTCGICILTVLFFLLKCN